MIQKRISTDHLLFNIINKKIGVWLIATAFILLIIVQDFLRAIINSSGFYFSESFMFSTFWWAFVPLILTQYAIVKRFKIQHWGLECLLIISPCIIHLFTFPLAVWLISKLFYYHTFAFQQTLRYTISEYIYLLLIIYSIPVIAYQNFFKQSGLKANRLEAKPKACPAELLDILLVSDGNKKIALAAQEIVYFSALPPYVQIHTVERKYLYNETLKSLSKNLGNQQFIRIHKSTIVNINMVTYYTSRLNGDYDLTLKNNIKLRVSRNYATDFKQKFQEAHRLTAL
ncbi:LytR/AlgR family response regulator transcription factor [Spirosoma fluminis]